jgi:4-amino-4-deoxy-L-arabinose transferase-like glycosyltransferase
VANAHDFRRTLWLVVASGALVRLVLLIVSAFDHTFLVAFRLPDDALYYFAIAENIRHVATAPLLSFDGIHATNGMHPLWVFTIAPLFWLGLGKWTAMIAVLALQSAIDSIVIWLIGRTVYDALDDVSERNRYSAAVIAASLYALNAVVVLRAINGLETTLAALLLALWLRQTLQLLTGATGAGWLGLISGLLILARTDTVILIAPALLWLLAREDTRSRALRATLIAAVLVLPWLVWNLATFGSVMQSSGLAVPLFAMKKYDALYSPFGKASHLSLEAFKNVLKPWFFAGLILPLFSLLVAWRRKRTDEQIQLLVLVGIGSVLLMVTHSVFRGFVREWYILMQIPMLLIIFGITAARNVGAKTVRKAGRVRFTVILLLLMLPLAFRPSYLSQELVVENGLPIVEKLSSTFRIASLNSGYYGYFCKRPGNVVNIDGVVNYDAYEAIRTGKLEDYLLRDSVDYVLDLAGDLGGYKGLIDHQLLKDFEYDTVFAIPGRAEDLVLYRRAGIKGNQN